MIDYSKIYEFKKCVPLANEKAYFITGSTGLVPDFVYNGTKRYIDDRYTKGGDSLWAYADGDVGTLEMMRRSKAEISKMLGCDADEILFGQNSSSLFNLFVQGIDFKDRDNIVSTDSGWIGTRFAMQQLSREGKAVKFVKAENNVVTADAVIGACDKNTKMITVNYIESFTGYKIDVDKIGKFCKEHDIIFVVDGVQAIGVQNIDVKKSGIDFIVGNDYKWMMNFCGTGFAYLNKALHNKIKHCGAGWMSDSDRFNSRKQTLTLRDDAGRFEMGYPNSPGIYGLGLVAQKYNEIGRSNIQSYVNELANYFKSKVAEKSGVELKYKFDKNNSSQIIIILIDKNIPITENSLAQKGIIVNLNDCVENTAKYEARICLHYYTSKSDIDKLFSEF